MHLVQYLNRAGYALLTTYQLACVKFGDYINSGLDLDTYMSLKDSKWPSN